MKIVREERESFPLQSKFATARREMASALIEREQEIDLVLTALVARENVLLVGPPGCAKSLLLDSLMAWMKGRRFSILLNKFTTPEELLGPISVAGLKSDVYRRVTAGKLPEADLAFIDECMKGSSAILNVLLKILNERTYEVGDGTTEKVPLKLAVAASNEWPSPETGKELAALFDRFVLRKSVRPIVTASGRQRLLWGADHAPKLTTSVTPAEVDEAHERAMKLPWADEAKQALEQIVRELAREGVQPGDRRQFKAVGVARAFAWLDGAERVEPEHLEVLQHVLWDSPEEQPEKVAQVIAKVANPTGMRLNQLLLECEEILSSTDVRNLSQAAAATAKLSEIDRQLGSLKGNGRVERARAYVKEQVRKIKVASIEAI
jgi:MoxR-like ATPase